MSTGSPGVDEETLAEVASEATEDGSSAASGVRAIRTPYSPKKEVGLPAAADGDQGQDAPTAMETDGVGDAGEEAKESGSVDAAVKKEADGDQLDIKVDDVDEVLKELMLYADMASRDCQPFLTRHAYVHR